MKTNKPLIDIKRLEWLITKGEASNTNGRKSFEYEMLLDLMKRLNVRVNRHEAHQRLRDVCDAKTVRLPKGSLPLQVHHHFPWQIEITENRYRCWGQPRLNWRCKTAREVLQRMKRLRLQNAEELENDSADWDDIKMTFHFNPAPKPTLP